MKRLTFIPNSAREQLGIVNFSLGLSVFICEMGLVRPTLPDSQDYSEG
jgi:hypothetical protein